jgi:hypothetical protein
MHATSIQASVFNSRKRNTSSVDRLRLDYRVDELTSIVYAISVHLAAMTRGSRTGRRRLEDWTGDRERDTMQDRERRMMI